MGFVEDPEIGKGIDTFTIVTTELEQSMEDIMRCRLHELSHALLNHPASEHANGPTPLQT
jgi:hypothetical protein